MPPFPTPAPPRPMPQLVLIQYLRALAALLVVVFHSGVHLRRMELPAAGLEWLASGVDVFFVISGLIMWVTTALRPVGPGTFLLRRLVRIVPLYWLLTSAMVAATLLVPGLLRTAGFDLPHVVASYLFIPWTHPVMGEAMPILVPGWTLNHEMAFYLLFGLALFLPWPAVRFWGVGAVLGLLVLAGRLAPEGAAALRFHGHDIVLEFWLGMALGRMVLAARLPGAVASAALLLGGLAALPAAWGLSEAWPRGIVVGLPAALAVLGALGLEAAGRARAWSLPLLIGDASYALYLSHVFVLAAVAAGWRRVWAGGGLPSAVLFVLLATLLACGVAVLLYRLVEVPLRDAMRDRPARPRTAAQARAV